MEDKNSGPMMASDGYQPMVKGAPSKAHSEVAAGYTPTTSQARPATPPTQSGSGKK